MVRKTTIAFEGFLPAKQGARLKYLAQLQSESRTMLFYESCHRLRDSIEDMKQVFGEERNAVIVRELTKMYEDVLRGHLAVLAEVVKNDQRYTKGEYVLVLEGAQVDHDADWDNAVNVLKILSAELAVSQATKLTAQITGVSKKRLYQYALTMSAD